MDDRSHDLIVHGEFGGKDKGGSRPTEAANTLQSKAVARILDLVSEGEMVGLYTGEGADGKKFPFKAIYFDNIPVQNANGDYINATLTDPELNAATNLTELNFDGVEMWERLGIPDQAVISQFSEVESEITINQQVTEPSPVLFVIAEDIVDAIRLKLRLPSLRFVDRKGNLLGTTLEYTIEVKPSGGSFTALPGHPNKITGKNTSPYEHQTLIDLAGLGTFPLTFKVSRVTEDSDISTLSNDLFVNSYTEIQRAQLTYADSGVIAIRVNSELFSGRVPRRSYLVRGIKIEVPSNYFPDTRTYTRDAEDGTDTGSPQNWDGTFYTAWSNNPAWVLYDILTNNRYGLGEFIDAATQVDKFSLYAIAVYCDEEIDTGLGDGTTEPRYSFNGVINTREAAFDVINAITSTFRGMSYWSAAGVTAVADSPKDPRRLITRANVINGHFSYSGTALRAQHTAVLSTYNDPENHFKQTTEVVEDASRRELLGWRELEVAAFATTSRGQAYRLGRWVLDTEKNESELLSFASGLELADLRPGDIIQVADPARQAVRRGGRIILHTTGTPDTIELDAPVEAYEGDEILVNNVLGDIESLLIEPTGGLSSTVTMKPGVQPGEPLQVNSIFVHKGPALVPEEWRILSMRETEEHRWEFSCLAYDSTKFARIEQNNILDPEPTSFLPRGALAPATNLTFHESIYKSGPAVLVKLDISWTRSTDPRAQLYLVEATFRELITDDVSTWFRVALTPAIHAEIPSVGAGIWSFRVTAMIGTTLHSPVLSLLDQVVVGKTAPPPNVENLTAVRGFVEVVLDWDDVDDIDLSGYVVQRGPAWSDDPDNDASVEVLANPVFASTFTATAKTVDTKRYHVRAIDTLGNLSREVTSVETSIQALPAVANLYAHQIDDSLRVDWDATAVVENIQYEIKYGAVTGTFDEATSLATVANSNYIGPLPVDAVQDQRIYVRPFVALATGNISYGTTAYIDAQLFPLNRGFRVKSQTEETAWSSNITGTDQGFILSGIEFSEKFAATDLINPVLEANYLLAQTPKHVSRSSDGAFHCNMQVNGSPIGSIMETGSDSSAGLFIGFDSKGDLIYRAGKSEYYALDETDQIHHWTLDEASGTRADSQGSNDLTDVGTVTAEDGIVASTGNAATFVSANSTNLTGGAVSIATGASTILFWFKRDSGCADNAEIFSIGGSNGIEVITNITGGGDFQLILSTYYDGSPGADRGIAIPVVNPAEDNFVADTWYHIAVVRPTSGNWRVYIDGVENFLSSSSLGLTLKSVATTSIGSGFDGAVDGVRVFTREIAEAEILSHYNANGASRTPSLIDETNQTHHWKMDEQSGVRKDSAGTNHLTDAGTVTAVTGQNGLAAEFIAADGTELNGGAVTMASTDFSFLVWFRYDSSLGSSLTQMVRFGSGGDEPLSIQVANNGVYGTIDLLMHLDNGSLTGYGFTGHDFPETGQFREDTWHMISVTWDESTQTLEIGKDGETGIFSRTDAGRTLKNATSVAIGHDDFGLVPSFEGDVDDIRVFSRKLSRTEIKDHYDDLRHGSARVVALFASIPQATNFDLVWDVRVGEKVGSTLGKIRMWVDGTLYEDEFAPEYAFLDETGGTVWSDTGEGKYNGISGTAILGEAGAYAASLTNVTLNSDLSYWRNQLVADPIEVVSGELTLTEGSTYGRYEFPFNLPSSRIGRLWFEMTSTSIAAAPLKIFDATMTIFEAGAHDGLPGIEIAESTSFDPSIEVWIDVENTGTYIPLVAGTYKFKDSTIRVLLTRGENETTRPAIANFSTHFIEQPADITLQADTTDATTTTLTYDGGAVTAANIPVIPDDFMGHVTGRMIAWKDDNVDYAEYNFTAVVRRATGVASTTIASFSITEEETDTTWLVELNANTTHGGLNVNVTGVAGTNIKWLCDIDIVRVIGSDA